MADISYWFDELRRETEQLRLAVEKVKSLTDNKAIAEGIKECDLKINRVKEIKKSFGLELRLVRERQVRQEYDGHSRDLENKLNECLRDLMGLRAKIEKNQLFGSAATANAPKGFQYSTEGKDSDTLLGEANKIQVNT